MNVTKPEADLKFNSCVCDRYEDIDLYLKFLQSDNCSTKSERSAKSEVSSLNTYCTKMVENDSKMGRGIVSSLVCALSLLFTLISGSIIGLSVFAVSGAMAVGNIASLHSFTSEEDASYKRYKNFVNETKSYTEFLKLKNDNTRHHIRKFIDSTQNSDPVFNRSH